MNACFIRDFICNDNSRVTVVMATAIDSARILFISLLYIALCFVTILPQSTLFGIVSGRLSSFGYRQIQRLAGKGRCILSIES